MIASLGNRKAAPILILAILAAGLTGMSLARNTLWQDAIAVWEDALAKSPGKMRVSYHLGRLYGDAGDMERAFSLMQRAGAQDPGFIAGAARNAEAFRQEGGLRAALLRHHDRIRQRPNDPVVRNDLGATLHSYGMAAEAYLEFSEAIRLDPSYTMAYANRGVVLLQQNALDEALQDFRRAVELEPGRPSFRIKLGIACRRAGKTKEAVAQFDAALRLDPGNTEALRERERALRGSGAR